jgi:hypothetical protein
MYALFLLVAIVSGSGTQMKMERVGEFTDKASCEAAGNDLSFKWGRTVGESGAGFVCVRAK